MDDLTLGRLRVSAVGEHSGPTRPHRPVDTCVGIDKDRAGEAPFHMVRAISPPPPARHHSTAGQGGSPC